MTRALQKLLLPEEVSPFERRYLARMNRMGLWFFVAHLPLLSGVAWINRTGVGLALALTCMILAGPALAIKAFENPRHVSMVHGFTAMLMGGLLVHFGQGPVQIEMHFYFFALVALLAVFANPAVVLVAAVTVALHHLLLWLWLPSSVFNYAAPLWVVGVHAAFVVLESVAVCFIARSFFDNVIGLERIVLARTRELDERNRAMRLVLDHVDQGMATLNKSGQLGPERSRAFDRWFGADASISAVMGEPGAMRRKMFELAWDEVTHGEMPIEASIDLLPKSVEASGKPLGLSYTPIVKDGVLEGSLVVVTDRSAELERERLEADRSELLVLAEKVAHDGAGVRAFVDDVERQLAQLEPGAPEAEQRRALHTLKGNALVMGLGRLAGACHNIEEALGEQRRAVCDSDRQALRGHWADAKAMLDRLLASSDARSFEADDGDYAELLRRLRGEVPLEETLRFVLSWRRPPVRARLERLAEHSHRVADRVGRARPEVRVIDNGLRLPGEALGAFWSALVHVVRNAVDHGLEPEEERRRAGKPAIGRIEMEASIEEDSFVVRISDDGRGLNLDVAAAPGQQTPPRAPSPEAALELFFKEGFSTAREVSDVSGRGVGLSAVRAACHDAGGEVVVETATGRGTTFLFRFPMSLLREERPSLAA